jgi:hypothetical protein
MFLQSAVEIGRLDSFSLFPRKPLERLPPRLKRRNIERHSTWARFANHDTPKT